MEEERVGWRSDDGGRSGRNRQRERGRERETIRRGMGKAVCFGAFRSQCYLMKMK